MFVGCPKVSNAENQAPAGLGPSHGEVVDAALFGTEEGETKDDPEAEVHIHVNLHIYICIFYMYIILYMYIIVYSCMLSIDVNMSLMM